ncbi:MAG: peptidoglycan-binding protein [Deltaproteobacteria bacterium]|nr:peptidoglycan-binding protein [Deltaproteobacteria bacterium]
MDTFRQLIDAGKWELSLPLRVRGVEITGEMLVENVRIRVSARDAAERILRLKTPALQGTDIKEVQQALVNKGIDVGVDGVFGPETDLAVKQFQRNRGLKQDGIVGPATRSALGL